jgi:hypothetical protein
VRRAWAQLYFELFPYRRPHATIPIRPSQQPSRMTIPIQPSHTTFSKDDSHTTISIRLCSHTTLSTTIPARVSSYDHARTMPFMFPSQASIQTTIPIRPPFPYNDYPHTTMPMRSTPYDRFHTTIHTRPSTHDHPHTTIHTRPSTHDHPHTTIHTRPFTHDHSHTTIHTRPSTHDHPPTTAYQSSSSRFRAVYRMCLVCPPPPSLTHHHPRILSPTTRHWNGGGLTGKPKLGRNRTENVNVQCDATPH